MDDKMSNSCRDDDTVAQKLNIFLEAIKTNRLAQEPLHLTCPGFNRHIEYLLAKFYN